MYNMVVMFCFVPSTFQNLFPFSFCFQKQKKQAGMRRVADLHRAGIHQEALHCHDGIRTDCTQWTLSRSSSCPISSWRIWWTVFQVMCPWSSINSMVIQWSLATSSRTVATISWFQAVNGCSLLNSLSRSSHHPLNHFKLFMWDTALFLYTVLSFSYISVSACAALKQNLMLFWWTPPKNKNLYMGLLQKNSARTFFSLYPWQS